MQEKPVQLSYLLLQPQSHYMWKYVDTRLWRTNQDSNICVCRSVCTWLSVRTTADFLFPPPSFWHEYDPINADMFFLQRPFISHPAPPLNTSPIVPIDCRAHVMRSHNTLTYGLMFDWVSIWQPTLQPCDGLSAVSQCQERYSVSVRLLLRPCYRLTCREINLLP